MSAAAVTPNVKGIVVCDEAFGSDVEGNVYTLEDVRQQVVCRSFPCERRFYVLLQLECARDGTYSGNLRFIQQGTEREVRRASFSVDLVAGDGYLGDLLDIPRCRFPAPGRYDINVFFWDGQGNEVQKGQRSFDVLEEG